MFTVQLAVVYMWILVANRLPQERMGNEPKTEMGDWVDNLIALARQGAGLLDRLPFMFPCLRLT